MATDGILSPGSSVSEFSSLPSNCNHVRPKPFTDPGCPSMLPSFIPLPRHDCLRGRHKLPSLSSLPFATGLHLDGSSTTTEEFYAQRIAELPGVAQGPSCVLPFLYIGSKFDALDPDIINRLRITHVVNVSVECAQSPYVPETNFLRVPLTDKQTDKILPHFPDAFAFIGTVHRPPSSPSTPSPCA